MRYLLLGLSYLLLLSCSAQKRSNNQTSELTLVGTEPARLQEMMTGTFTSGEQARQDSSYYDITLHMYPIWPEREGAWLYVEQTVTATPDRPYRQRIYQLVPGPNSEITSEVYEFEDPKPWVGKWREPATFETLTAEDIRLKAGCGVVLRQLRDASYTGQTGEKTCPSSLRGASYATSQVTIQPGMILSWDQGWNEAGEQVWGATEGGYVFRKQ